jgi:hypothetical protein
VSVRLAKYFCECAQNILGLRRPAFSRMHEAGALLLVPRQCRFRLAGQCDRVEVLQLARVLDRDGHMFTLQLTVHDLEDLDGVVVEKVVRADMEPGKSMLERARPISDQRTSEFVAATAGLWRTCQAQLRDAGLADDTSAANTPLTRAEIEARLQLERQYAPAACDHSATSSSTVYYTDQTCSECGVLLERCFDFDDRMHDKTAVYDFAWFAAHGSCSLDSTPRRFVQCPALMRATVAHFAAAVDGLTATRKS